MKLATLIILEVLAAGVLLAIGAPWYAFAMLGGMAVGMMK